MPGGWAPMGNADDIVVPGLDPQAPLEDQLELLDQLITMKLQNVDAIWADIHHIIVDKILPAVKRYAQATQPTREAAFFWKSFYETAANIQLPTPGETSMSGSIEYSPGAREDEESAVGTEGGDGTTRDPPENHTDGESYHGDEATPSNHSFNPAVSSTPVARERYYSRDGDVDTTTSSSASVFPDFTGSLQHPAQPPAMLVTGTSTSSINLSNVPIFSTSPSPAKTKGKGKGKGKPDQPLRMNLLRQNHLEATSPAKGDTKGKGKTPIRMKNPFRQSTVFTSQGEVVDLGKHSPSTSTSFATDFTLQSKLSPTFKRKFFGTPQNKLALRSKEEAVAIQMSEARARASDYSSSEDYSAPPTPMTARKLAQHQREQQAILQERFDRDCAREAAGLPLSDDDDDDDDDANGDVFSDDSFSDDDDDDYDDTIDGNQAAPGPLLPEEGVGNGYDDDSFDQTFEHEDSTNESIGQPLSRVVLASSTVPLSAAKSLVSYESTDDQYEHEPRDEEYSNMHSSDFSMDPEIERTGPTETLFGMRAADKQITEAEWQRKLSRPLPGRILADAGPLDSPTPAEPAGSRWAVGPGKVR